MSIQNGFTIWARKTVDSDIFVGKPHVWFKIWFYLVTRVDHDDLEGHKRGTAHIKYEWIAEKTGATRSEVDHACRWFRDRGMLATTKAIRGFIVTVLNYDKYQNLSNYKSDSKSDLKATRRRHVGDTIQQTPQTPNILSNDNMVAAPQVFGNKFVNLILQTFKERKGFLPIDKSIRREGYALSQRITSFNKARGRDGEADFVKVLNQLFDRMEKEDAWDKIQRLEPVRLRAISWFDAAIEKGAKND